MHSNKSKSPPPPKPPEDHLNAVEKKSFFWLHPVHIIIMVNKEYSVCTLFSLLARKHWFTSTIIFIFACKKEKKIYSQIFSIFLHRLQWTKYKFFFSFSKLLYTFCQIYSSSSSSSSSASSTSLSLRTTGWSRGTTLDFFLYSVISYAKTNKNQTFDRIWRTIIFSDGIFH